MAHYRKRHVLQMSLSEHSFVENSVKRALNEHFENGGSYEVLPHAAEMMELRLGFQLPESKVIGTLKHGILEEIREVVDDNGRKDFRVAIRSSKTFVHGRKNYVIIYSMTYHQVVTVYYRSPNYAYEDRIGNLDAFTLPPVKLPGLRKPTGRLK